MPVTLTQSFDGTRSLPSFPNRGSVSTELTPSGNSTAETDAPKFAIASLPGKWQSDGVLTLQTISNANTGNTTNLINTEYLSEIESAMDHESEGDVVRSSALYLLHPVNQALSLLTHNSVRCRSEAATHKIRSDITYYRAKRPFAVVEFKKRGVIRVPEFRAATKTITPTTSELDLVMNASGINRHHSFFGGNSAILIKQAASYAINHRTRYVVLFNWDMMVLCYFTQLDHTATVDTLITNGVGNYCEVEIIPFSESHRMRPSLLGFLANAYQNTPSP